MSIETFKKSQLIKRQSVNLKKLGFDFSNEDLEKEYLKIQSLLYTDYHINCESMLTIMKRYDIKSSRTMDILFREFDIEARSFSEGAQNALALGRSEMPCCNSYHQGWHTSWFGEPCFLRSSYELDYATTLDNLKIKYYVESLRIKYFDTAERRYRIAIPDFYLPEDNTIVEIKSSYWFDEQNMIDKQQSYTAMGYKFKLILDKKEYSV